MKIMIMTMKMIMVTLTISPWWCPCYRQLGEDGEDDHDNDDGDEGDEDFPLVVTLLPAAVVL